MHLHRAAHLSTLQINRPKPRAASPRSPRASSPRPRRSRAATTASADKGKGSDKAAGAGGDDGSARQPRAPERSGPTRESLLLKDWLGGQGSGKSNAKTSKAAANAAGTAVSGRAAAGSDAADGGGPAGAVKAHPAPGVQVLASAEGSGALQDDTEI